MISDREIQVVAEKVRGAVWASVESSLSDGAKGVVTAGEISAIAKAVESAAYAALIVLKTSGQK